LKPPGIAKLAQRQLGIKQLELHAGKEAAVSPRKLRTIKRKERV